MEYDNIDITLTQLIHAEDKKDILDMKTIFSRFKSLFKKPIIKCSAFDVVRYMHHAHCKLIGNYFDIACDDCARVFSSN